MKELSAVTTTMSSLEIAELTGKNHADVLRDVKKILKEVEIDHSKFAGTYLDKSNRQSPCFNLQRRECDLIIAGYSAKYRLVIIDRWQELESEKLKPVLPDFTNPIIAARAWADEVEAKLIAQQIIEKQQQQISNKDQLIVASNEASIKAGEILVREFVKSNDLIDLGEKQFYEWMREHGYILKGSCEPSQKYVKLGYFTWKPTAEEHGGKFRYTLRITARGKVWLAGKYLAYLDSDITA